MYLMIAIDPLRCLVSTFPPHISITSPYSCVFFHYPLVVLVTIYTYTLFSLSFSPSTHLFPSITPITVSPLPLYL